MNHARGAICMFSAGQPSGEEQGLDIHGILGNLRDLASVVGQDSLSTHESGKRLGQPRFRVDPQALRKDSRSSRIALSYPTPPRLRRRVFWHGQARPSGPASRGRLRERTTQESELWLLLFLLRILLAEARNFRIRRSKLSHRTCVCTWEGRGTSRASFRSDSHVLPTRFPRWRSPLHLLGSKGRDLRIPRPSVP